jgi:enterochelin esterase-like enzyme
MVAAGMHALAALLSALLLEGFAAAAREPHGGQLLSGTFPGLVRPGYLYLPPGFDRRKRYPVVYLLHGMPGSPSEYVNGMQFGTFADEAVAARRARPFIGVIPGGGPDSRYNGEWAGPWERALVDRLVPWVDAHLPTIASPRGRIVAGLSAGGFGAVNAALRHPGLFGTVESWSGYFVPLRDGPFKHAGKATLAANNPTRLARAEAAELRRRGVRFFLSTGPFHSHWFTPVDTLAFADELRDLGVNVKLRVFVEEKGEWRNQLAAGLVWALPGS